MYHAMPLKLLSFTSSLLKHEAVIISVKISGILKIFSQVIGLQSVEEFSMCSVISISDKCCLYFQ